MNKKLYTIMYFLKENLFLIFLIIILLHSTNFFYNYFSILNRSYEERMIRSYGYCEKEAYGFIKESHKIISNENLRIVNLEDNLWPNISNIFTNFKKNIDSNYIIFLNLKNFKTDKDIINFKHREEIFSFKKKDIIYKFSNCYLVKND